MGGELSGVEVRSEGYLLYLTQVPSDINNIIRFDRCICGNYVSEFVSCRNSYNRYSESYDAAVGQAYSDEVREDRSSRGKILGQTALVGSD